MREFRKAISHFIYISLSRLKNTSSPFITDHHYRLHNAALLSPTKLLCLGVRRPAHIGIFLKALPPSQSLHYAFNTWDDALACALAGVGRRALHQKWRHGLV